MSNIRFQGNPSGTGTLTIASPNTNSDFTLNLPTANGTIPLLATVTNNGVMFINGSGQPTTGSALTFDGTKLTVRGGNGGQLVLDNSNEQFVQQLFQRNATANTGADFLLDGSGNTFSYRGLAANMPFVWALSSTAGNPVEQMRLTSTGLGIGTSSPAKTLHVSSGSYTYPARIQSTGGATTGIELVNTGSSANPPTIGSKSDALFFETNNAERMRLDSVGNLGLGVTPSAWGSGTFAIDIGSGSALWNPGSGTQTQLLNNSFNNGTNFIYKNSSSAARYRMTGAQHEWYTAPSGTAGNTISFTQAMTLDASGNLGVGTTSPQTVLHVQGAANEIMRLQSSDATTGSIWFGYYDSTGNRKAYCGFGSGASDQFQIWSEENDAMVFATNNAERMRIDSGGNFGIGTSSPVGRVESRTANMVAGNPAYDKKAFVANIPYSTSNITSSLLAAFDGSIHGADIGYAYNGTGYNLMFATNSTTSGSPTERARIDSSGNFLIGGTTANGRLDVAVPDGTTNAMFLERTGASPASLAVTFANQFANLLSSGVMTFSTAATERMRLDSSGNLLVNTTTNTNSSRIVSNGVVESTTGGFRFPDGTTQTTAASGVPTTLYAVGTYILGRPTNTTQYLADSTLAGSSLRNTGPFGYWNGSNLVSALTGDVINSQSPTVNVGTWRCVSVALGGAAAGAGMWLRIS